MGQKAKKNCQTRMTPMQPKLMFSFKLKFVGLCSLWWLDPSARRAWINVYRLGSSLQKFSSVNHGIRVSSSPLDVLIFKLYLAMICKDNSLQASVKFQEKWNQSIWSIHLMSLGSTRSTLELWCQSEKGLMLMLKKKTPKLNLGEDNALPGLYKQPSGMIFMFQII